MLKSVSSLLLYVCVEVSLCLFFSTVLNKAMIWISIGEGQ